MKILVIIPFLILASPLSLYAQKYIPDPLELAPQGTITCSWSSLNSQELKECKKKKLFFDSMSSEEKEKYNERIRMQKLDSRLEEQGELIRELERRTRR